MVGKELSTFGSSHFRLIGFGNRLFSGETSMVISVGILEA